MPIMLERHFGPREILPASLWPGLTIGGAAIRSWQQSEKRATANNHVLSNTGIWLPSIESSEADFEALARRTDKDPSGLYQSVSKVIANVAIENSGCWTIDAEDHHDALETIVHADVQAKILEPHDAFDATKKCDGENCVYHRHYDLTYGVPSGRRELLYPNTEYFHTLPGGEILTAWGDKLPSVDESRAALAEFQKKCMPYVPRNESLLTTSGISQLSLLPTTGCWFVRSYYMTPVGKQAPEGWQYDGYGRLRIPREQIEKYKYGNYAMLAHRVTWVLSGNKLRRDSVLNHKCGFRPCANPGHIEQVSQSRNTAHGLQMSAATSLVEGGGGTHQFNYLRRITPGKTRKANLDEFYSLR